MLSGFLSLAAIYLLNRYAAIPAMRSAMIRYTLGQRAD
jgi:hypothetical protein